MPTKILILDVDPMWHAIKHLENRVAVLEGGEAPHVAFCKACRGSGQLETLIAKDHDLTVVCRFCDGKGK